LMQETKLPSLVIINKMDLCQQGEIEKLIEKWKSVLPRSEVIAISAASGINSRKLIKKIAALLPESPPYYDKEQLSDRNLRFFVSELVREKIFLHYQAEIPYASQVEVEKY